MTTPRLLPLLALLVCTATATAQAPANDDCANAQVAMLGLTSFDSTLATDGTGLPLDPLVCDMGTFGDEQLYQDVWFSFSPPASGNYDIASVNNGNPAYDSRLAVYDQGTCPDNPANVIACDDDSGPILEAAVTFVPMVLGNTYLIRIGSYSAATTEQPAALSIAASPATPANDDCSNAATAMVGLTNVDALAATNGTGLALDPLVCDMGTAGDEQIYADVWFTFTAPATDDYDIAVINNGNPSWDSRIAIYDQSTCPDDPANVVACDDDSGPGLESATTFVPLVGGVTYLIRVGSFSNATTEQLAALSIGLTPPPPANDDCANAAVAMIGMTPIDTTTSTLDGTALDPLVCDLDASADERIYNDVWYTFTPATTGSYDIDTDNGTTFDTRIAVYSVNACPADPANVIACADDSAGFGTQSFVQPTLTGGTTYLIRVGSDDPADRGTGNLTIAATPPPPANDDCANAISVMVGLTSFDSTSATDGAGLPLDPLVCDMGTFGDDQLYQDVWFSFTPGMTNFYDIASVNNGNTSFDSRIAIYDQSTCPDNPANVIGCDDDEGPGLEAAALGVSLTAGTTYLIRIGSFSATTTEEPAALSIAIGSPPPMPPPNDNCANAEAISGFGVFPYDNGLATTDGSDLTGFCDVGPDGDEQIHSDIWFSFTATSSGCTYISTLGLAGFDTRLAVYSATTCPDDPASIIACVDDEILPISSPFEAGLDVVLTAGTTYLIRVGNFSAFTLGGPASLQIAAGPVAENGIGVGEMQPGWSPCPTGPAFPSSCNGDGGDQLGCTDCPCGNNAPMGTVGGCINSSGNSSRLDATGDPSVSLPSGDTTDLRFTMSGGPAVATSVLLSGGAVAPTNMANPCFGLNSGAQASDRDGLRCAVQSVLRHGNRQTNAMGDIMDSAGPNRVWGGEAQPTAGIAGASGFAAGQTRFFQVTHRDDPMAVCMRGLNTSQAVEVTFTP